MKIEIVQQQNDYKPATKKPVQKLRFFTQIFSVLINVWIGIEFYLFVQYVYNGPSAMAIERPPGVEGWLPIGSLVSLRHWLETGVINDIHPAGMIIFIVILLTALLFKKGFCSWVCPVGFISEMFGDLSDKLFRRRIKPPAWLDYPLRSLKYLILAFFGWAILISYTSNQVKEFIASDYNVIADFLMLRFFTDITTFALTVVLILVFLSLIVRGFWCRYLCPYGALLGILNFFSPTRIVRNEKTCIDCSSCANACPAFIKVDKIKEVRSDECSGCMACVDSCPVSDTLNINLVTKKKKVSSFKWAAVLILFFWGGLLGFKLFGPWQNSVSYEQYRDKVPYIEAGYYTHP